MRNRLRLIHGYKRIRRFALWARTFTWTFPARTKLKLRSLAVTRIIQKCNVFRMWVSWPMQITRPGSLGQVLLVSVAKQTLCDEFKKRFGAWRPSEQKVLVDEHQLWAWEKQSWFSATVHIKVLIDFLHGDTGRLNFEKYHYTTCCSYSRPYWKTFVAYDILAINQRNVCPTCTLPMLAGTVTIRTSCAYYNELHLCQFEG